MIQRLVNRQRGTKTLVAKIVRRRRPTMHDIYWAAGFLEGEGHFRMNKGSFTCSASQVQREPLDRLHDMFGGRMYRREGKVLPKAQTSYIWLLCGVRGVGLAMTLYSIMSPRRKDQIWVGLMDWRSRRGGKWSKNMPRCVRGHERFGEAADVRIVTIVRNGREYISRQCRACHREWRREDRITAGLPVKPLVVTA